MLSVRTFPFTAPIMTGALAISVVSGETKTNEYKIAAQQPSSYCLVPPRSKFLELDDYNSSTAISVLSELHELERAYPLMASAVDDARKIAYGMPWDFPKPDVWTDGDSEVAFEWKHGVKHAMMSFEGDGIFGYAMRQENRFVPGSSSGDLAAGFPDDLRNYLPG
jgi:hypothetical protein